MDIEKIKQINKEISQCKYISEENQPCSRDISSTPFCTSPAKTQKILLISNSPSNIANSNNTLIGFKNTFFRDHILSSFFSDYNKVTAKADETYFKKFCEKFNQLVYCPAMIHTSICAIIVSIWSNSRGGSDEISSTSIFLSSFGPFTK